MNATTANRWLQWINLPTPQFENAKLRLTTVNFATRQSICIDPTSGVWSESGSGTNHDECSNSRALTAPKMNPPTCAA